MTPSVTQDLRSAVKQKEDTNHEGDLLHAARDNPAAFAQRYDRYVHIHIKASSV